MEAEKAEKVEDTKRHISESKASYSIKSKMRIKNELVRVFTGSDKPINKLLISKVSSKSKNELDEEEKKELAETLSILGSMVPSEKMTQNERYLLMMLISTQHHDDSFMYELTIEDEGLKQLYPGVADPQKAISRACNGLAKNYFSYQRKKDGAVESRPIVTHMIFSKKDSKKIVKVQINPFFVKCFTDFKNGNYTTYSMVDIIRLKPSSEALYASLKALDKKINNKNRWKKLNIYLSIEETMNAANAYRGRFASFKKEYLEPAIKDINKNSDINVSFKKLTAQEKRELSDYHKGAEMRFTVTLLKKSPIENLMNALEEIVGKEMTIPGSSDRYEIESFKPHPIKKDILSVSFKTEDGEIFVEQIQASKMEHEFREFLSVKIEATIPSEKTIPGEAEFMGESVA